MGLLYELNNMNVCGLYECWIQWLFVAGAALKGNHYRIDIISGVVHPRSDLVVLLVLCMITCNGWATGIVLQVPRDSVNDRTKFSTHNRTNRDSYSVCASMCSYP
jgi:hypothetical protein